LLAQHEALAAVARSPDFRGDDLAAALRLLTETTARVLSIQRVSLWRYTEDHRSIHCLDLYELGPDRHSAGSVLEATRYPGYFRALATSEAIVADDAHKDPSTSEFSETYLTPLGITAMLDIPLLLFGKLEGVLCHEQIGPPRPWRPEDRLFGIAIANFAALAVEHNERKRTAEALRDSEALLRWSEEHYRSVVENLREVVFHTDLDGRYTFLNAAWERLTGFAVHASLGTRASGYFHSAYRAQYIEMYEALLSGTEEAHFEAQLRAQNGELCCVEGFVRLTRDEQGWGLGTSGTLSDISERKASEARIQQLAYHDPLTGLPNRALLLDRLDQALAEVERHERTLAVLYLDLDRFKLINDSRGHHVGDRLLEAAGARMRGLLRAEDTVARLGGDEFVVVLPDVQAARDPAQVAEKIISALAVPFDLGEHRLHVTASIGISVYPCDGRDRDALLRHADAALYQAKEQSRNTYRFFDAEINRQANQRLAIENGLRVALERGELTLHYQPLFDLRTLAQTGVEALLRWRHPERGLIPSAEFIAIAEGSGLIVPIGRWVLSSACQQAATWRRQGLSCARIAVNISARQLRHDTLVAEIREALTKSGLDPADLDLEITESSVMHETLRAGQVLEEIDALGVQLTMDDFGTGYSSLSYLKRFPLDRIKIDKTFVRGVPADPDDVAIVQAIVAMAHQLRLKVVAEGVETAEQRAFLEDCGCDEIQGYLLGPPLPAEHFPALGGLVTERA